MTTRDLIIEGVAGAAAAVCTALLMERARPAARVANVQGAPAQHPPMGARLAEGVFGYFLFRTLMGLTRRTGQAVA